MSRRSIRYYEQHGLLEARRSGNGWREYDEHAVLRVANIRELLRAGLTMEDIGHVVPCLEMKTEEFLACEGGPDGALPMYERRLAAVEAKAAELEQHRAALLERIARMRSGAASTKDFAELLRSTT